VKKKLLLLILPAATVVLLDQVSKAIIVRLVRSHGSVTVIEGFFNIVHIRNRGMAFGLLNREGSDLSFYLLVAATTGAIALLLFWFISLNREELHIVPGLALVLGGALGNLIDRLRFREVIDFLDFFVGSYHWPAFNVADSAITVGAIWIAIHLIFKTSRHVS
jgi:signal peptidase II